MKQLKKIKIAYCILAACLMLIGGILLFWPGASLTVMFRISGFLLIGYGAVKLLGYFSKDYFQLAFQYDLALGIASAIIGFAMIFRTKNIISSISICIGIFMLIDAGLKIQTAIDAKRFGIRNWGIILGIAVVVVIAGILLFFLPFQTTELITRLMGFNIMLDGILNIWIVKNTVKTLRKASSEEQ